MITSPDHALNWFHTTISDWKPKSDWCHLLLLTLFFPPQTCCFIANSTESSQQRHEPMPASLTFWSTRAGESRETWPKDQLFSWSSSSHLVVVLPFLEVRRYLPDTSHASCRRYSATRCCGPPPAVARFFRSLAARQGRCQPHFSVLDWDFSKLFELNEMVIQQKMRWVLQLDMNLMAKSPCLIEFNIYKDQKRCEYTSKCLVHARQDFRFVHPDDYASKPNFSQSGCPNPTLPHRVAIFTSLGSHDSTSFSLSSLPALPKFLFLTWVWLFVWVNKKIIKQKIPSHQPFDLSINSHVSQLPATSNHVTRYKSRSVGVTLSWSRETCHGSSLWTKPTTRSGFKAWTVLGLQKYVSITE